MKQIKFLIFLCFFIPNVNYGQKTFNSIDEYLNITAEKTGFDKDKIIIKDFIQIDGFVDDVVKNNLFTFYGVAYNSELFSAAQLQNKSCWGQFLELCKDINEGESSTKNRKITEIPYLNGLSIDENKKTVIFIYGRDIKKSQVKNFIKPILDEVKKDPTFDYVVLSLDYPWIIKK